MDKWRSSTYTGCCGHNEEDEDDEVQDEHAKQNEQHFEAGLKQKRTSISE